MNAKILATNDGNTFLGTLLASLTVIEAEVITFDREVFFLKGVTLCSIILLDWNVPRLGSKDILIRSFQGWTVLN